VDTADKNNQVDADILQCKADVLRARDIIPPFNRKPQEHQTVKSSAAKDAGSEDTHIIPTENQQGKPEIPKFDLAEQILAQHRKVTATRRKAPEQKTEFQVPEQKSRLETHIGSIPIISFEQEQVILEIVARDIQRLYSDMS
jgi:hypothetical protein